MNLHSSVIGLYLLIVRAASVEDWSQSITVLMTKSALALFWASGTCRSMMLVSRSSAIPGRASTLSRCTASGALTTATASTCTAAEAKCIASTACAVALATFLFPVSPHKNINLCCSCIGFKTWVQ